MGVQFDEEKMKGYWLLIHVEEPHDAGTKEKSRHLLTLPVVKGIINRDDVTEVHPATPSEE